MDVDRKAKTLAEFQPKGTSTTDSSGTHEANEVGGNGKINGSSKIPNLTESQKAQIFGTTDNGDRIVGGNVDGGSGEAQKSEMGHRGSLLGKKNKKDSEAEKEEIDGRNDIAVPDTGSIQTMASSYNAYSDVSVQKVPNGNLEKNLKSAGGGRRKRGRPRKAESTKESSRLSVDENQVDSIDDKIADKNNSISRRTRNRMKSADRKEEGKNNGFDTAEEDVWGTVDEPSDDDGDADDEVKFSVGDFVWGKIKSQPCWPGWIYDPSNASDYALEYKKQEGRLLVAYFGEGTFAWCTSSQLKPFVENFTEMSQQSHAKGFFYAVNEAVHEFSRLVELTMTLPVREEKENQEEKRMVVNSGIKRDVYAPEGGIVRDLTPEFKPELFLSDLRNTATYAFVPNMLEVSVLKSQLSAFCQTQRGYTLIQYSVPQDIGDEKPSRGPMEEEDEFVTADSGPSTSDVSLFSDNDTEIPGASEKGAPVRKERLISELLRESTEMVSKEEKSASKRGRKKRKTTADESPFSARKDESPIPRDISAVTSTKTRRSSRNSVTPATPTDDDDDDTDAAEKDMSWDRTDLHSGRKRNTEVIRSKSDVHGEEETGRRSERRERKISKYLSPPYTIPEPKSRNLSAKKEPEASSVAGSVGPMAKAAEKMIRSPPIVKCTGLTFQTKQSKEVGTKRGQSDPVEPQAPKSDKGACKVAVPEVLSALRDVQLLLQTRPSNSVVEFLSSHRDSSYELGSGCKTCKGCRSLAKVAKAAIAKAAAKERSLTQQAQQTAADGGRASSSEQEVHNDEVVAEGRRRLSTRKRKSAPKHTLELTPGSGTVQKRGRRKEEKFEMEEANNAGACNFFEGSTEPEKEQNSPLTTAEAGTEPVPAFAEADGDGLDFVKKKLKDLTSMLASETDAKVSDETRITLQAEIQRMLNRVNANGGSSSGQ